MAIYKQAQAKIMQDAPWIFINSTTQIRAVSKTVHGFTLNPLQMFSDMQDVYLAP